MGWWPITRGSRPIGSKKPRGRVVRRLQTFEYVTAKGCLLMLHTGRAGITCLSRSTPAGVRLWAGAAESYDEVLKVKKKQPPGNSGGQKHLASVESNVLAQCHAIVKHCAITQYDDGEPRKPGWVSIKTFGSAWQVEAKDPDSCLSLRVVENSLDEALLLLNLLLESEEAPWELDTWLQQQSLKKSKKG